MKPEFFRFTFEKTQISNFMKIHPVGAELFHADRRTEMTKLIVAFHNFAKAPKNALYEDLRIFQNLATLGCHN